MHDPHDSRGCCHPSHHPTPPPGGVVLTMATVFALGVLATNAEPALNVLGQTVESLSDGQFSKRLLVWAVSIGVAIGMDVGACKILFSLPLIYFILGKYAVASALTVITKEGYAAVAWDSAGASKACMRCIERVFLMGSS